MCNIDMSTFSLDGSINVPGCNAEIGNKIGISVSVDFDDSEKGTSYYCHAYIRFPDNTLHDYYLQPQPQYIYNEGHADFGITDLQLPQIGTYKIETVSILDITKQNAVCYVSGETVYGICKVIDVRERTTPPPAGNSSGIIIAAAVGLGLLYVLSRKK